jgi:hypothetical protein
LPNPADYRAGDVLAHHIAWYRATGLTPPLGLIVGHTCDVRRCVRHDDTGVYVVNGIEYERHGHLWLGAIAANQADMAAKMRGLIGRGGGYTADPDVRTRRPHARLNRDQAILIRTLYANGTVSQKALAAQFNVSQATISLIVTGKGWT